MGSRPGYRPSAGGFLALAGILLLAAVLRLREAAGGPYWFDEIYTLWMGRLSWPGLFHAAALDIHPPLHFVVTKLWRAVGGEGEVWIRSSSILAGLATIVAVAALGREAFGARAGVVAGLLLAVHLVHVGVSAEARFYALLALCVWSAALGAWRWTRHGGAGAAVLLVAAEAAGLWTHYLAGAVWLFLFAWGALALRGDRRRLAQWLGLHVAVGLLFAPQLPTFLAQLGRNADSHWVHRPYGEDLLTLLRRVGFGAWYLVPAAALAAALPFFRAAERRAAGLVATLVLGPVVLTWGLTMLGAHLFTIRYMYFVVPGVCVLVAAGLAGLPAPWLRLVATALLAGLALRTAWIRPAVPELKGLGEMRAALLARAAPGEPIVCADPHTLAFLRHYGAPTPAWMVLPGESLPYWEGSLVIDPAWLRHADAFDSLAASGRRWWFVRLRTGGSDTRATLARALSAGAERAWAHESLTVWRVDPPARALGVTPP